MWLLASTPEQCRAALEKLHKALAPISPGPITVMALPGCHIGWFRAKPSDNFHCFEDGCVLGKLAFDEPAQDSPIRHAERLPSELHPLLNAVRIRYVQDSVIVEPQGIAHVFYRDGMAADTQLAIAAAAGLRPCPKRFAVLATVGYLPGTLTLFDGVRKLDLFQTYDLGRRRVVENGHFQPAEPDDRAMVERLTSLVPVVPHTALGISGGADSRFVLGILLRAGVRPRLLHLESNEAPYVAELGRKLGLETVITRGDPALPGRLYSILTDGQIYFRGGSYSRLREHSSPNVVYHCGLFADSLLKNAFKTAWKVPCARSEMPSRLFRYGLLNLVPPKIPWLRGARNRVEVQELITSDYGLWIPFLRHWPRKAAANWMYFHSRGVRWSYATTLDLQFFCHVVFLLSDLEALKLGIASPVVANFQKARARRLNRELLPGVDVPYSDGLPVDPPSGVRLWLEGLYYEFFHRLNVHLADQKMARAPSGSHWRTEVEGTSADLSEYLSAPLDRVLEDPSCPRSVKRAAVTLTHVLEFLGS